MVRVTLSETELQTLRPGEFYDVPPAVGRVLVCEGWAIEPGADTQDAWNTRSDTVDGRPVRRSSS